MRSFALTIVAICVFVLQLSFIPALRPFGIVPNLGLVLVALVGLYGTASSALVISLLGGLALDLVSGADFGLSIGLFMVVGLTAGFIHRAGLNSYGPLMAVGLVMIATLVQDAVVLGGLARVATSWPVGRLTREIFTEVAVNSLLAALLQPVVRLVLPVDQNELELRN